MEPEQSSRFGDQPRGLTIRGSYPGKSKELPYRLMRPGILLVTWHGQLSPWVYSSRGTRLTPHLPLVLKWMSGSIPPLHTCLQRLYRDKFYDSEYKNACRLKYYAMDYVTPDYMTPHWVRQTNSEMIDIYNNLEI